MNSRWRWIVIAVVLALAAAILWQRSAGVPQGNLAGSSLGGSFALVDQDGRPVTDKDFAGQYRLMYFGYTFCPDVCPTDVGYIARALGDFEKTAPKRAARVTPMFITVDPQRDDVAAVKAFGEVLAKR